MSKLNSQKSRSVIRLVIIMLVLLTISSFLIFLGSRGDASTVAQRIKSGVLTADEINVAFENVGGTLIERNLIESQEVKKGQLLLALDEADTKITLDGLKAKLEAAEAELKSIEENIIIRTRETDLEEDKLFREIEQAHVALHSAVAAENLARVEFERSASLINSKSISKSLYDSNLTAKNQAQAAKVQAQRRLDALTLGASQEQKEKLEKTGSASGMTLVSIENARLSFANMHNDVKATRARIAQLQSELDRTSLDYRRLKLYAPEDGKVLKILYQKGEIISPNSPAVILETKRRYFDIYVSEKQVKNYAPGTKVKAQVVATEEEVEGTVRFATAAPSFADLRMTREHGQADLTMFKVRIYIDEKADVLCGMTLEVNDE